MNCGRSGEALLPNAPSETPPRGGVPAERKLRCGRIRAGGGGAAPFLRLPFEFQEIPVVVAHAVIGEPSLRRWSSIAQPLIVYCETIRLAHLRNWTARSLSILNPSATMTSRL